MTWPAEWRFYRGQKSWKISPGCILFILIRCVGCRSGQCDVALLTEAAPRYLSMATIVVSNVGYFATFSKETCDHYYIAAPVFKGEISPGRYGLATSKLDH